MAYIVMAKIALAYIAKIATAYKLYNSYIALAYRTVCQARYIVMAHTVMAHTVLARTVLAYIVMAYTVTAYIVMANIMANRMQNGVPGLLKLELWPELYRP